MKKYLGILVAAFLITSCGSEDSNGSSGNGKDKDPTRQDGNQGQVNTRTGLPHEKWTLS